MKEEASEWETRYQSGDTPWNKNGPHPALQGWLVDHSLPGRVLVPGCGAGHDVRALSAASSRVVGLDIAPSAIRQAQAAVQSGSGGETYVEGDFFQPPADWQNAFDGVFEHTCFCAIPPDRRSDYARAVSTVLRPGGLFLAIFYLDPGADRDGPPFGCTVTELDGLFGGDFIVREERRELPTFPGREGRELWRLMEKQVTGAAAVGRN